MEIVTQAARKSNPFDRDLQWLNFNERVLHEALSPSNPILERVGFLGIFNSNLDEFFMKRMGFLLSQIIFEQKGRSIPGRDPKEHLLAVRRRILELTQMQSKCFHEDIQPHLRKEGIFLLTWEELSNSQREFIHDFFLRNIFPVLTPIALDPGHPFPFISNLSHSLAVSLFYPGSEERVFSRIKIPTTLPQLVRFERDATGGEYQWIRLSEVIANHLQYLFPKMDVGAKSLFRITRNAELEWSEEEEAENLLEWITQEIRQRRFGEVVRLEFDHQPDPWMQQLLMEELEVTDLQTFEVTLGLDTKSLKMISELSLPKLRYPQWSPVVSRALGDEKNHFFNIIRAGDVLVHHPYESFTGSVVKLVEAAIEDPKVHAIKMTVYRTGGESPFIPLLVRAAEAGKQVVCLVELRARFDEEQNIYWARQLEEAGVHVVYGLVGFKTHAKIILIVRQENESLRSYAHIGTGNYNKVTANLYEDFGLFTSDPRIVGEIVEVFNYLTGRSLKKDYQGLIVAPINMREEFLRLISQEAEYSKAGEPAQIIAKFNSLEDQKIIQALYEASQAGVKIHLIVRGFCCLQPGVKGQSENIIVDSIVGRFLEHSRLYYFRQGQKNPEDGKFYISSADWMYRNLNNRVEVAAPILRKELKVKLWAILLVWQNDMRQAWRMHSDGHYEKQIPPSHDVVGTQESLMRYYKAQSLLDPEAKKSEV